MIKSMRTWAPSMFLALLLSAVWGAEEPLVFDSAAQEAHFYDLTQELRCLVCQNQNLADSDAPLAHDLRKEIYRMMMAGDSDEQIKAFLVDRYGDFVLYRPPMKSNTVVLWSLPALLLVIGAVVVTLAVRRQSRVAAGTRTEPEE